MYFRSTISKRKYEVILLSLILIYTIIFTYHTCLKHHCLNSYAWDLEVFNQVFHSSIFGGRFFYYTPDLFNNSGSS